jgi:hypothetical protein
MAGSCKHGNEHIGVSCSNMVNMHAPTLLH